MKTCMVNPEELLYFDKPASAFEETFLLGNGQLGATVYGSTDMEVIELNHENFWTGAFEDKTNYEAFNYLEESRRLIREKKYEEADTLIHDKILGPGSGSYVPLGTLVIKDGDFGPIREYKRTLSLSKAVSEITYRRPVFSKAKTFQIKKEQFTSFEDNVLVMRYTAEQGKKFMLTASLLSDFAHTVKKHGEYLHLSVKAPYFRSTMPGRYRGEPSAMVDKETVTGNIGLRIFSKDGIVATTDHMIMISGSTEVTFLLAAETNFVSYDQEPDRTMDLREICEKRLQAAEALGYEQLYERHVKKYSAFYNTSQFKLAEPDNTEAADRLIRKAQNGELELATVQKMFCFAKYLFICSASGRQPANLQGLWNRYTEPPFASGYTLNINLEMNYWACEKLNLSMLTDGLINFIEEVCENGKETAKIHYGAGGSCAHSATELWRVTAAVPALTRCGFWPMAGGWLTRHLWEHYLYTNDMDYLREKAYHCIVEFTEFFADWMIEEADTVKTIPSTSPENQFKTAGGNVAGAAESSTMDLCIIKETFEIFLRATEVLKEAGELSEDISELRESVERMLPKIKPFRIGSDGRLLEWGEELEEFELGHRHFSHMYGLYPAQMIRDKEVEDACRKSIECRMASGGAYTGWSCAWLLCLYARLRDSEKLDQYLKYFFAESVYDNFLTSHPPFQIDANFGFLAAVCEMLLQVKGDEVILLPAVPKKWNCGQAAGLKIPGNFQVDICWENGKIIEYSIYNEGGKITENGLFEAGKVINMKDIFPDKQRSINYTEVSKRYENEDI